MPYRKDQWSSSFEDQLSILRPHLSGRVLATMSLSAWHEFGTKEVDPIKAAKDWSKRLDAARKPGGPPGAAGSHGEPLAADDAA